MNYYVLIQQDEMLVRNSYFMSFLRQNCVTNKSDTANTLYKIYDKHSIIELIV